jgi:Skp family chaperone for outer membrane proteins
VKRTVGIVVGVLTLGVAIYVGSRLSAQQPGAAGGPKPAGAPVGSTKTRVALLNLKYVVTNYRKWTNFQEEYKVEFKKFQARVEPLEKQLETIMAQGKDPKTDAATKDKLEKDARNLQRQMQDIGEEAKATLGKKESDMLVIIYREVAAAVARFSASNDIDLVLHYNDATTPDDMNTAANIQRKMGSGPCTPLYWKAQEVDISAPVLQMLDANYRAANPTPPGTSTTAAAPAH